MKNKNSIKLTSLDDLFETEDSRKDAQREKVMDIPLGELYPFLNHPFQVRDDEAMTETAQSVKEYGVLVPAIARPREDGGYELVSGHRRKRACELAGLESMPVLVRPLEDDAATIIMVDSNLQREQILPSERAFAYKMKMEAMKRQGARSDLTSRQIVGKLSEVADIIGQESGESGRQIQRYIRLTELVPELLEMVDQRGIAMNSAYELSFLSHSEQKVLLDVMESEQSVPSLSQAQRLKKFSQQGGLDQNVMVAIMSEEKKDVGKITLKSDVLKKYFPQSYTPQKMEETIIKLLEQWQRKRQQQMER